MKLGFSAILFLPKNLKRAIVMLFDALTVLLSLIIAYYLRLGFLPPVSFGYSDYSFMLAGLISLSLSLPIFVSFGFYRNIFRYLDANALKLIFKASLCYGALYFLIILFLEGALPRTIGLIQPITLMLLLTLSRISLSYFVQKITQTKLLKTPPKSRALIYGAGALGRQAARILSGYSEVKVVGFLDDDKNLQSRQTSNLRIHDPNDIKDIAKDFNVNVVILAVSKLATSRKNEITQFLLDNDIPVKVWPSTSDIAHGVSPASKVLGFSKENLLRRDTANSASAGCKPELSGEVVLVTGGGGSIGSELCKQIIFQKPKKIVILENNEYALYLIIKKLEQVIKNNSLDVNIVPFLGSMVNKKTVTYLFDTYRPDIVYHAAAYKHVPLVEQNVLEGLRNNVFGTLFLVQESLKIKAKKFILVSSDKAVRPTNVMGATKRLSEMLLQAFASKNKVTNFVIVRFGNVLESSGSVVPLFREQISMGGPVTVTHKDTTRYFMTISEAVELVIEAGKMSGTHEVKGNFAPLYILDMGEPVKIYDLAKRMIFLSGRSLFDMKTNEGEIEISIIGLRPGEKLHEELLIGKNVRLSENPKIYVAREDFLPYGEFQLLLKKLQKSLDDFDKTAALKHISEGVPEYKNLQ